LVPGNDGNQKNYDTISYIGLDMGLPGSHVTNAFSLVDPFKIDYTKKA